MDRVETIDVAALTAPLDGDSPAGPNLEYDAGFAEMEQAAAGTPEQQYGDTVVETTEPDWKQLRRNALAVAERTRDLRAAVSLTQALLHTDGFAGLADGLGVTERLLADHWDHVHPELDPDDDNDPTMRLNALAGLVDPDAVLKGVRAAPLVQSRILGTYGLRDWRVAHGDDEPRSGEEKPDPAAIEGAFLDVDLETVQATAADLTEAIARVGRIDEAITQAVGGGMGSDFTPLTADLQQALKVVSRQLDARGGSDPPAESPAEAQEGDAPAAGAAAAPPPQGLAGEVTSREDVVKALDKVCDYYARREPSSPVPLLVKRARRLVTMNFAEIIADLAPDAGEQLAKLFGADGDES